MARASGAPACRSHIFRLAGIYGPGRNQLAAMRDGTARRIVKPGQVFSRIHVDDIAGCWQLRWRGRIPAALYNVCDDEPAPPQEVVALCRPAPRPGAAAGDAIRRRRSSRRWRKASIANRSGCPNRLIKDELGYRFRYPTYREGLASLLDCSRSTVARLRQLLDGRDQERDVAGPRQPMVAALDQGDGGCRRRAGHRKLCSAWS